MGTITTGIGLFSGVDYGAYIDAIIISASSGKFQLQERVATLQAKQTALLDVNARLLNLKSAAAAFRSSKIFQSATATSNNLDVLTASASTSAQPGSFTFIVSQLAASSQKFSAGFADLDSTPLGLTSMSFEFGHGTLSTDTALEDLNGGNGVDRGNIKITDRSGAQATIDLTDVISLNEVLDRINEASDISVTASIEGDHLVLTDTSGGTGTLTVVNSGLDMTATDLGIAGSAAGDTLTGTDINTLGLNSALASLNDGNGVLIQDNVTDFRITARDGTDIDVDLGRLNADITTDTLLEDLNNGAGVTLSDDEENPDLKIVDRDGTEYEIDLTGTTTVGQLITAINSQTSGRIQLSITDGEKFTVTDTVGGTEPLKVLGAGENGTDTAEDLGILNVDGVDADSFDGTIIPNTIQDPQAATLGDVIDRINNAENNGGKIVASLGDDGVSLKLTDTTGGAGDLIVASRAGNPDAARQLGLETAGVASDTHDGERLVAALGSVMIRHLNGGSGLGTDTDYSLTINDRNNGNLTLNLRTGGVDAYHSLSEIVDAINASGDVDATASLNSNGTGLLITDNTGSTTSNLTISGTAAAALGIEADVAENIVEGSNLQLQYVSHATKLSDLNYGRGVGTGSFRIRDGYGETAVVSIGGSETTLYDVIEEINSKGLAINARINDNGDGLLIEEVLGSGDPFVTIKVENVSGTAANDLNILGESDTVLEGAYIDGSYERVVEIDENDTLTEVVAAINNAGIPVSASTINIGSGATPYHLSLTSEIGGAAGELIISTVGADLGLSTITEGQDAKVFFGSDNPADAFLITSTTNTIKDVVTGLTIDLVSTSDNPVTVTVERDETAIIDGVKQLVTTLNDALGRIDEYDFYDVDAETKGVLLGNPTTAQVRNALFSMVTSRVDNVNTQYQYLHEVGITVGSDGQISFDESKFQEAYDSDPTAVENLFAAYEAESPGEEEILPGVTVTTGDIEVTSQGFGPMFNSLLDGLTNSIDGVLTLADQTFTDQIDFANKRIETIDQRLEARRARLEAEFIAMEKSIALLQNQSGAISSLSLLISNTTRSTSSLF